MKTILVGTDFSPLSDVAVETGLAMARRTGAKRVHLVHVLSPSDVHAEDPYAVAYSEPDIAIVKQRRLEIAEAKLGAVEAKDLEITREVREGTPAKELCASAHDVGADLVVVSSHGYGAVRRVLLGSVASALIRTSDLPVLVVGADRRHLDFEMVVAGADLSPISGEVIGLAYRFTRPGGRLQIVSACEVPLVVAGEELLPHLPTTEERAAVVEKRTARIRELLPPQEEGGPTVSIEALPKAPAALAILESAEIVRADLIVIGTSGHNAWHRMILGSTATRVLSEAACPVLVVPHHPAEE